VSELLESVDREITEPSEVQQLRVQLYRVNGSDSSQRRNCDTTDGSSCEIVNCVTVRANVEKISLY
jgi:hypothetical protein